MKYALAREKGDESILDFTGKTALVTGASAGIGRATAMELAQYHADLVLLDVDEAGLAQLKEQLSPYGVRIAIYECDISDEARVNQVCVDAIRQMGKIDILVNNAGLWRGSCPFAESESAMWRKRLDVNVLGTLYMTRALINPMLERGWGRIINVASVSGVYGIANMADYSLTKGALIAFTAAFAKEVTGKGVLVNCVSPGSVAEGDQVGETALSFIGRTGACREYAHVICFLASEEASYISGQNYIVDGCRKKL